MRLKLELVRIYPDGRRELRELDANSWLKNYAGWCHGSWTNTLIGLVDVNNSAFNYLVTVASVDKFRGDAGATTDGYGIQVGTGSGAVDRDNYKLGTKVAHGNGAGQLYYQACTITPLAPITGGYEVVLNRQFDNNSGGDITVNEVGLVVKTTNDVSAAKYVLVLRDLIPGGETVVNGTSTVFRYKLQWTA